MCRMHRNQHFNDFIMKNKLILKAGTLLFFFGMFSLSCFSQQSVTIGTINNGKAAITNSVEASKVLKAGLAPSAVVSNLRVEWVGGDENKYYLIGNIEGDVVSAKGVELKIYGTQLRALSGPGIEITCAGLDCSRCDLRFVSWKPQCLCERSNGAKEGSCNMTVKLIIAPW